MIQPYRFDYLVAAAHLRHLDCAPSACFKETALLQFYSPEAVAGRFETQAHLGQAGIALLHLTIYLWIQFKTMPSKIRSEIPLFESVSML